MSEVDIIKKALSGPVTREGICRDLGELGVSSGMVLLAHSSLSQIGWVSGGAPAVILGIEDALGTEGTLVMPAHSGDLSDPLYWSKPPRSLRDLGEARVNTYACKAIKRLKSWIN